MPRWPMEPVTCWPPAPHRQEPNPRVLAKDLLPILAIADVERGRRPFDRRLVEHGHADVEWAEAGEHDAQSGVEHAPHEGEHEFGVAPFPLERVQGGVVPVQLQDERHAGEQDPACGEQRVQQEENKKLAIVETHCVDDPRAKMVHVQHDPLSDTAEVRTERPEHFGTDAEVMFCRKIRISLDELDPRCRCGSRVCEDGHDVGGEEEQNKHMENDDAKLRPQRLVRQP
mmetsp:Transcript_59411/g.118050  ORF Transcript_59411/g.118050 Transcript_59411/m.118050 type:complete len:228 (-) Transcript_59411:274-957(-)